MNRTDTARRRVKPSEEGYALLAVIFLMVLLVLWLSVAAPRMVKEIQRDREVETVERGRQYTRAVQLYYRKFHAYPPTVDALVKTNDIRFLRKKYIDPMTGKDDWKPILYGQAKVPPMGFFGQPLAAGSSLAGIGPAGGNGVNGASTPGTSIFSTTGAGSASSTTSGGTSGTGDNGTGASGSSGTTGGTGSVTGATGTGTTGTGTTGTAGPTSGQTFGGAGIVGFSPALDKESMLTYRTKNRYGEWEFTYDPATELTTAGNTGAIGQPASATTNPVGNSGFGGNPFSTPPPAAGAGTGTGTTSTPATPPETTAPPQ
jgi:type II secretory pathway pseudopilin PulG